MKTFACGCATATEPRNMGRGAARQKRLAEYYNRKCMKCAVAAAVANNANPNLINPLTTDQLDARIAKIKVGYL